MTFQLFCVRFSPQSVSVEFTDRSGASDCPKAAVQHSL